MNGIIFNVCIQNKVISLPNILYYSWRKGLLASRKFVQIFDAQISGKYGWNMQQNHICHWFSHKKFRFFMETCDFQIDQGKKPNNSASHEKCNWNLC